MNLIKVEDISINDVGILKRSRGDAEPYVFVKKVSDSLFNVINNYKDVNIEITDKRVWWQKIEILPETPVYNYQDLYTEMDLIKATMEQFLKVTPSFRDNSTSIICHHNPILWDLVSKYPISIDFNSNEIIYMDDEEVYVERFSHSYSADFFKKLCIQALRASGRIIIEK